MFKKIILDLVLRPKKISISFVIFFCRYFPIILFCLLLEENAVVSEDESSSDSEIDDDGLVQLSYTTSSMTGPIGQWEEYTKVDKATAFFIRIFQKICEQKKYKMIIMISV